MRDSRLFIHTSSFQYPKTRALCMAICYPLVAFSNMKFATATEFSAVNRCGPSDVTCQQLAQSLLGPGVVVSNVQCRGACGAFGTFTGGTPVIGIETGVIRGTGAVTDVIGLNNNSSVGTTNLQLGDLELDALIPGTPPCFASGKPTCDGTILEFDFSYTGNCEGSEVLSFQYVLASDEYHEYIESPLTYNDVFGFFLNGDNIAFIPGTISSPVSIGNLNCGSYICPNGCDNSFRDCPPYGGPNCNLLRNNDIFLETYACMGAPQTIATEMDALTVVLTATGFVNSGPTATNHLKLAIADVLDTNVDTNVFLKSGSFVCQRPTGACCDRTASGCVDNVDKENCLGEWLPGLTCEYFNPPCHEPRMLVLLDRTSSMNEFRHTGNTRCTDALTTARQDVVDFFENNPHGKVAVWTFRRPAPTPRTNGFVDETEALAALDSPLVANCYDSTPLAESMCLAVDALLDGIENPLTDQLILAVSSDGGENVSDGECAGPYTTDGVECGQYDVDSWQQLVCDKIINHAVVMVRYWGALQAGAARSFDDDPTGFRGFSVSDDVFFDNLVQVTGGQFVNMDDSQPPPTGACCDGAGRCQGGVTPDACDSLNGTFRGLGSQCAEVTCETIASVPAISTWSSMALALALTIVGINALRRQARPIASTLESIPEPIAINYSAHPHESTFQ